MARSGIYTITSKLTGRVYVGSTISLSMRINVHLSQMRRGVHSNRKIRRHFNKYGETDLIISVLEYVPNRDILIEREQFYIDTIKPYFNLAPKAGNCLGVKHSTESRERRKALKNKLGKRLSDEQKLNVSKGQISRFQNPIEREKARLRATGNTHKRGQKLSRKQILGMTGENHYNCKLSDDHVREIRSSHIARHREYSCRALAQKYGVAHQFISRIVHFKERKHVI